MLEIVKIALEKEVFFYQKRLQKIKSKLEERIPFEEIQKVREEGNKLILLHKEKKISSEEFLKKFQPLRIKEVDLFKARLSRLKRRNISKLVEEEVAIEEIIRELRSEIWKIDLRNKIKKGD